MQFRSHYPVCPNLLEGLTEVFILLQEFKGLHFTTTCKSTDSITTSESVKTRKSLSQL